METDDTQVESVETQDTPQEAPQEEAPQLDPGQSQIMARIDELAKNFPQPEPQAQFQPEPEIDPYQQEYEPFQGQEDQGLDAQRVQQMIQQGVQEAVNPILQERQHEQILDLEEEFPDLRKPEVAQATLEASQRLAHRLGQPDRAVDPELLRMVYLAERASKRAESEVPAGQEPTVELEAGAAAATQPPQELSEADRIVAAGKSNFWTGGG